MGPPSKSLSVLQTSLSSKTAHLDAHEHIRQETLITDEEKCTVTAGLWGLNLRINSATKENPSIVVTEQSQCSKEKQRDNEQ